MNRVVARFQDGSLVKGVTYDFQPGKDRFHVAPQDQTGGGRPVEIRVAQLKALFFVKSLDGNRALRSRDNDAGGGAGRRIRVVFNDGEVLVGTTQGYDPARPGFFVVPADPKSNNIRCYVVAAATREVGFL